MTGMVDVGEAELVVEETVDADTLADEAVDVTEADDDVVLPWATDVKTESQSAPPQIWVLSPLHFVLQPTPVGSRILLSFRLVPTLPYCAGGLLEQ